MVTGDLEISGGGKRSLKHLRHVLGSVRLSSTEVSLPNLALVSGDVEFHGGNSLAGLAGLEVVEGDFTIFNVKGIENLKQLESLQRVEGTLTLDDLPKLKSLPGPDTRSSESISLWENPVLRRYHSDSGVITLECVSLKDLPSLEKVRFGRRPLVEVMRSADIDQTGLTGLADLVGDDDRARLDVGCELRVSRNPKLESMKGLGLRLGQGASFWDNPNLPQCQVDAIEAEELWPPDPSFCGNSWGFSSSGNDEDAVCM